MGVTAKVAVALALGCGIPTLPSYLQRPAGYLAKLLVSSIESFEGDESQSVPPAPVTQEFIAVADNSAVVFRFKDAEQFEHILGRLFTFFLICVGCAFGLGVCVGGRVGSCE